MNEKNKPKRSARALKPLQGVVFKRSDILALCEATMDAAVSDPTLASLNELRKRGGGTKADILRKCVAFEKWWIDTLGSGGRVIVRYPDGTEREIVRL
jgi:hypothetical protein